MSDSVEWLRTASSNEWNGVMLNKIADEIEATRREKEFMRLQFVAAMTIAIENKDGEGLAFLEEWFHGDPKAMQEASKRAKKAGTP
jgi:hypothetical protein